MAKTNAEPLQGLNPRKPFFLALMPANADGSLDLACEGQEGYLTEAEALAAVEEEIKENDWEEGFVFVCTPILHVKPQRPKVTRLKS